MAKKKEEDIIDGSDLTNLINKKYGKIIRQADEILEQKLEVFSTGSPNLDLALGGGIQEGSCVEISGLPKIGKTSLCMQILTSYMKAGRATVLIDAENRFDKKNLQIHGLDPSKLTVIRSEACKVLDANDTLNLIDDLVKTQPGCAIVLDSMSSLISRERATSEVDGQRRDTRPKLYSDWIQGISPYIRINRVTLILVRHVGMNQDPRGKKYVADSGMKVEFRKDVGLQCVWAEKWQQGKDEFIGKVMHYEVTSSNFTSPKSNVDVYLRFGYGIDEQKETLMQAIDYGIVEKSSSWLNLSYLAEPIKLQGEDNVVEYLKCNPESYQLLKDKIKELLV